MGYGIIAVPTGIVTVELGKEREAARLSAVTEAVGAAVSVQLATCPRCGLGEHDSDARFCKWCGEAIVVEATPTSEAARLGPEAGRPAGAAGVARTER